MRACDGATSSVRRPEGRASPRGCSHRRRGGALIITGQRHLLVAGGSDKARPSSASSGGSAGASAGAGGGFGRSLTNTASIRHLSTRKVREPFATSRAHSLGLCADASATLERAHTHARFSARPPERVDERNSRALSASAARPPARVDTRRTHLDAHADDPSRQLASVGGLLEHPQPAVVQRRAAHFSARRVGPLDARDDGQRARLELPA